MKDSPQDMISALSKPMALIGNKDSLDAAQVWARAICHSTLGPVKGEQHYRKMQALPILLAFRAMLAASEWH